MIALHPAISIDPRSGHSKGVRAKVQVLCIIATLSFSQTVFGQAYSGEFLYPGLTQGSHQYNYKDVILVSWYSNISSPILSTWARPAGSHLPVANYAYVNVASNGSWPLSFQAKVDDGSWTTFPVQLHMNLHDKERHGFNGVGFLVTSDPTQVATTFAYDFTMGVTTPTILPTTAPSSSPLPVAPTSTTDAPQRTGPAFSTESMPPAPPQPSVPSSPPPAPPSRGLSTGAKVGIGLGVGFGALIILGVAAAMFAIYRRRQQQRRPQELYVEKHMTPIGTVDSWRTDTATTHAPSVEVAADKDGRWWQTDYFPSEVHAVPARYEMGT